MHSDTEALALLSQQILLRDTAVREDQLVCRRSADTHLLLLRTEGKAGCSLLHDKGRDLLGQSAALLNRACDRKDNIYVSFLTVGDKALGTVQYPLVAVQHCLGLLSLSIRTCTGLCQAECA